MMTVWLIDDDAEVRHSLALLLKTMGWQVEIFASAGEFLALCQQQEMHGCLLSDVRMPGKSGLTLLEELQIIAPLLPVILMTGHGNIDSCRRAFRQGAFEFLTKPLDAETLIETLNAAFLRYQQNLARQQQRRELVGLFEQLTARETEVVELLTEGKTSKEIAQVLHVSPRTVEAHRANVFTKLDIYSVAQLSKLYERLTIFLKD